MKKIIMTYTMEFDDDVSDKDCYSSAIEVMSQDRHWPNDDEIKIVHEPSCLNQGLKPEDWCQHCLEELI